MIEAPTRSPEAPEGLCFLTAVLKLGLRALILTTFLGFLSSAVALAGISFAPTLSITFSRVLRSKDKSTGCTVHYVNERLDSGKTILQKKVFISPKDNEETLKIKVQKKEHRAFSEAIFRIYN